MVLQHMRKNYKIFEATVLREEAGGGGGGVGKGTVK